MAAEWVRYTAESRQRNPNGARVFAWEIGNELYHKGDASGGSLSPEAYSDRLREFAREMRAVDPAARIGAIGLENYPTFEFNSYRNWNGIVLQRAGGDIDFMAVHNGYAPVAPAPGTSIRHFGRHRSWSPRTCASPGTRFAASLRRTARIASASRSRNGPLSST
jgi:alpha-N-arabinofuranosidase